MNERDIHGHASIGWPTPPGQLPPSGDHPLALPAAKHYTAKVLQVSSSTGLAPDSASFKGSDSTHGHQCSSPLRVPTRQATNHTQNDANVGMNEEKRHNNEVSNVETDTGSKFTPAPPTDTLDPFRMESTVDNPGGVGRITLRRDSAASLSTISEVRGSPPQQQQQQRQLLWAGSITGSPRKLSEDRGNATRSVGDAITRGSGDSAKSLQLPQSLLPCAPLVRGQAGLEPPNKPSEACKGGIDRVRSRLALWPLQISLGASKKRDSGVDPAVESGAADAATAVAATDRRDSLPSVAHPPATGQIPILIAPRERQPSSACSVRSHWSDDSDEEKERDRSATSIILSRRKGRD